ncbi:MAG: hypothetical protein ACLQA5_05705, partial [Solirubrobacteraceae bacterium]
MRVGNAVHLGYPARPWLYQPLGRTGPSQSFGKLHDELQGLIPGGERGRAPRGVNAWLRLSVVRLGHRCCDPRGSISPSDWEFELGPLGLGDDDGRLGASSVLDVSRELPLEFWPPDGAALRWRRAAPRPG